MIEHRGARHLVETENRLFAVRPEDRVYQGFSLSFDASVEEVWLAFHAGAALIAATPGMERAGPDLPGLLTNAGVTVLSCVPTLLAMVGADIPAVRLLILGGEACPAHLVDRWARPGRRIVNTYGPTETTVIATCAGVVPGRQVTIGRAIAGYQVHLLDDALRPVRRGETGEIWIGGAGVARGYVNLPEQTAARFLEDPFAPVDEPDARIYRTGDLGRLDGEGNIEFHGPADSQAKIRGFRVELDDIESALLQDHTVRAAACALHTNAAGVSQLTGYVVPDASGRADEGRLRARLRERLPAYMIPASIATVTGLPRLPSGKLDRTALPAPRIRAAKPQSEGRPPRTETERRLARLWAEVLHVESPAMDDPFFLDLGGDSLSAAGMVSELRHDPRFAAVSMIAVYDHPAIASPAAALDAGASVSPPEVFPAAGAPAAGIPRWRHFAAGLVQAFGLYFVFGVRGAQWITPYLVYFMLLSLGHPVGG